jgi:hypothetical protein
VHAAAPPTVHLSTGTYDVVRVGDELQRIDYRGDGVLDVELGDRVHASYPLTGRADSAPHVLAFWHEVSPGRDALAIQLDQPTAAVLAQWTFGGTTTEWVVAPQTSNDQPNVSVVVLGETGCGTATLPPAQLGVGGALELVAIGADGTRTRIAGLPAHLAHDAMPRGGHALSMLAVPQPTEAPPARALLPADWNPMRGLDDAMTYALLGGALFVGLGVAALRSKRKLREA